MLNKLNIHNMTPETFYKTIKSLGRYNFPNPNAVDPDGYGVVALGGDLAPETLISAYAQGLFPWFNEDEPIAWWCPEPRCVIVPSDYQPSKSLRKQARRSRWQLTVNQAFDEVIHACSLPRSNGLPEGEHTWIHQEMIEAYTELHRYGFAHSVEVWDENGKLIGGLYGLKIGHIYFGESMFHRASNASKLINLTYEYLPFDDERLSTLTVEQFARFYHACPKPILMFCGTGARAKLLYQSALMQGLL